jgi:hypothetical protein
MRKHSDAGFTVAEALIATVLTMIVVGSALGTFTTSVALGDTARLISSTNQGMQAAMSLMVRDFLQAGQGVPRGGIPVPTGNGAVAIVRPSPAGAGLTYPAAWVALPAVEPGGSLGPTVLGVTTDLVNLFYQDPNLALGQYPLVAIAADGSTATVDPRTNIGGADGLAVGDIILFNNALGTAAQAVTAINGQLVTFAAGDPMGLNQRNAPQGTLMQLTSGPGAFPPTTATRLVLVSYYIDVTTDPNVPRLVRQVNLGQRLAIALGVENLQFTYDLVDGTTNPSNVETPPAANSANQIRKANLFIAARSLELSLPTGQFVRNSMAAGVGLRSLSFVDRYR